MDHYPFLQTLKGVELEVQALQSRNRYFPAFLASALPFAHELLNSQTNKP